jgi:RNA polymerase sigma-70 factor, ECF subfamily
MPTDHELMIRVRAGDAGAFDTLFERHGPRARGRILRIVQNGAAADDVLQDVFLRLWTRADQWAERGPLIAWLLRMATNLALNHLRSVRRRRHQPLVAIDDTDDESENLVPGWMIDAASLRPDELVEAEEEREVVRGLLDALPDAQRQVLRMANEAEMDIQDIANELDIPPGTVKSRLHYARSRLAREWSELSDDGGDR